MYKYIFTTPKLIGEVEFEYNSDRILVRFEVKGSPTIAQFSFIFDNLPKEEHLIYEFAAKANGSLVKSVKEITFEDFWIKYDDKICSSKKKTEVRWKLMPKGQQIKAYNYIYAYFQSIGAGVRKKYAETYLNSQLWEN